MGKHRKPSQNAIILTFMKKHPDIARNFTKGDRVAVAAAWDELTLQLNALGPPIKTAEEWRNVWKDWKLAIKKKLTHNKKESRATGGGPFNQMELSATEEEIAQLCDVFEAVDEVAGAKTFGIQPPKRMLGDVKENVDDISIDEELIEPSQIKTECPSSSSAKAPTSNTLTTLVAEESLVLRQIKDELVELKYFSAQMLEERKKTNVILENLVIAMNKSIE